MEREIDNPYDSNAVKVIFCANNNNCLGYLPRDFAKELIENNWLYKKMIHNIVNVVEVKDQYHIQIESKVYLMM